MERAPVAMTTTAGGGGKGRENYPFCVLVESMGSNSEHDSDKMSTFLDRAMNEGLVTDGALSHTTTQVRDMWSVREGCNPAVRDFGSWYNYKYDLSLPPHKYYSIVEEVRERLLPLNSGAVCANWGHVADGNLHLNVALPRSYNDDIDDDDDYDDRKATTIDAVRKVLEPFVYQFTYDCGGSISAEHGLGREKNRYVGSYTRGGTLGLDIMRSVKESFDPRGIMNPGKYLP